MGVTLCAGGAYRWYRDVFFKSEKNNALGMELDIYKLMDNEASNSPPGSNNLIFLPYLIGERCPYADPSAKGSFIGLTLRHSRGDITRALMEGVIFSLRHVYEQIEKMDTDLGVSEIRVSGGGSVSNIWRQIHADIFQIPVRTVDGSSEGGAYGAAFVAGVGCGIWGSVEEAVTNLKIQTENIPNSSNRSKYCDLYGNYKELYPILKHVFENLSTI
jgi:xylulokinase